MDGAAGARNYFAALSCFMRRDLRRAALFLCRTPFLAARSSSLTAARTAAVASSTPAAGVAIAWRAFVMYVFTRDLILRLRARRFCSWRMRFLAEGLLGI